ncbi:hypothetical protein SBA2_650002 [Acidobacteriia bacterium SbA2]|nr:hypothetical protein SBA2_650002 [Acidobacteriia bacterium SbA2]
MSKKKSESQLSACQRFSSYHLGCQALACHLPYPSAGTHLGLVYCFETVLLKVIANSDVSPFKGHAVGRGSEGRPRRGTESQFLLRAGSRQ